MYPLSQSFLPFKTDPVSQNHVLKPDQMGQTQWKFKMGTIFLDVDSSVCVCVSVCV